MSPAPALALPLFGPRQYALPWSDPDLRLLPPPAPGPSGAPNPAPAGAPPAPGQLCFGANQIPVWDIVPEPLQPSLLAEPPLWEAPPSRPDAPPRNLTGAGALPGQLHFFA